jgi:4-hydroxybenzoate polyprenyltransferase
VPAAEQSRLQRVRKLTRASDWWDHKVPVILSFAYWVLLGGGRQPEIGAGQAWWSTLAFVAAVVGVAAFGHVLNDLFDAEQDQRAGKVRPAAVMGPATRAAGLAALVVLALAPWLYLPSDGRVWALLGLEVALLVGYSAPPLRVKERGALALVFDASYAFTVPVLLALATFTLLPVGGGSDVAIVALTAGLWSFATGWRGIVFHQLDDLASDREAGVDTWAQRVGPEAAVRRLAPVAVAEPVLFCALLVALADRLPLLPWWIGLALLWRVFQLRFLDGYERSIAQGSGEQRLRRLGFDFLNPLYERWLPVVILGTLVVRAPQFWPLLLAHAVVFSTGPVEFVRHDLRLLPSFRFTAGYWLTYWLGRFRGWRVRRRLARLPATPTSPPARGRFVFVVCGPDEHIQTLHLALDRLRPRTNQEILVVTDSSRNRLAVEHDRVIDVATPSEMDDHQASIWLKTSLHRHVPLDRTACYLDSDIVAVRPDLDAVFDHYGPPVTFAPDRMIHDNCLDRFSPWAMTCSCAGVGDTDSCGHLREGLLDLWEVEPPGGWLPWNGGVFLFGPESRPFLDAWHGRVLEAFADPRFKTRDQHALVATVWADGLQEHPLLPREFNTIVDLGSYYLTWYGGTRYAVHPDEPPVEARFLHLYTNDLHLASFDLSTDVEEVVLRQMAYRSADSMREMRSVLRPRTVLTRGVSFAGRIRGEVGHWFWVWFMPHLVWTPLNLVRRVGRSLTRRGQVLVGTQPSAGGRRDALRLPGRGALHPPGRNQPF